MQIKIEILGSGIGNGQTLQNVLETALKAKGYQNYTQFAEKVAEVMGTKVHAEVASVSRVMLGSASRLASKRARAYAHILGLPAKEVQKFGGVGKHFKNKPIIVDDSTDVSRIVKKLSSQRTITLEDLVKELLYLQHQ